MSTDAMFLRKARRELDQLLEADRTHPLSGGNAYRALVLLARLQDAPGHAEHTAPIPERLHVELAGRCVPPLPLCDKLARELPGRLQFCIALEDHGLLRRSALLSSPSPMSSGRRADRSSSGKTRRAPRQT